MKLRRIRAVARKELLHILRDVRSLLLALALPVLMLVMFGYALSLDVERIPTAFYDADRSVLSGDLVEDFSGSRFFKVGQAAASLGEMERMIEEGGTMLGISIPQNFGGDIKTARPVEVQLLLDGSDSNTAAIALGYAEAVVAGYSARVRGSVRGGAGPPTVRGWGARRSMCASAPSITVTSNRGTISSPD
jgi:ABC-2 type transport system permease protein